MFQSESVLSPSLIDNYAQIEEICFETSSGKRWIIFWVDYWNHIQVFKALFPNRLIAAWDTEPSCQHGTREKRYSHQEHNVNYWKENMFFIDKKLVLEQFLSRRNGFSILRTNSTFDFVKRNELSVDKNHCKNLCLFLEYQFIVT